MIKIFKSLNEGEIEKEYNKFEEKYIVTDKQYSTCFYQSNSTCKVWHCLMVTYKEKDKNLQTIKI